MKYAEYLDNAKKFEDRKSRGEILEELKDIGFFSYLAERNIL